MSLSGLSGLQGISGIQPAVSSSSSSIVNWSLMPNVPIARRTAIETALINAAAGQSYTAQDIFATLGLAGYYWSFEQSSVYTDNAGSTLATTLGDSVRSAKDWRNGDLMQADTDSPAYASHVYTPGILSANGLEFDNLDGLCFVIPSGSPNIISAQPFSIFTVTQLVSPTSGAGGDICGFSNLSNPAASGYHFTFGDGSSFNNATKLQATHGGVSFGNTTWTSNNNKIITSSVRNAGSVTVEVNGTNVRTSSSAINSPNSASGQLLYVGRLQIDRGSFTTRTQAFMTFNVALTVSQRSQITRFMSSYYQVA